MWRSHALISGRLDEIAKMISGGGAGGGQGSRDQRGGGRGEGDALQEIGGEGDGGGVAAGVAAVETAGCDAAKTSRGVIAPRAVAAIPEYDGRAAAPERDESVGGGEGRADGAGEYGREEGGGVFQEPQDQQCRQPLLYPDVSTPAPPPPPPPAPPPPQQQQQPSTPLSPARRHSIQPSAPAHRRDWPSTDPPTNSAEGSVVVGGAVRGTGAGLTAGSVANPKALMESLQRVRRERELLGTSFILLSE